MEWVRIAGYLAAAATTISFLPQAFRTISTKDTKGISLGMYIVYVFGIVMWLTYGIGIMDLPIISANTITLVLTVTILIYKLKYK
jgi:MtN3 and saliva related transmembrane protein